MASMVNLALVGCFLAVKMSMAFLCQKQIDNGVTTTFYDEQSCPLQTTQSVKAGCIDITSSAIWQTFNGTWNAFNIRDGKYRDVIGWNGTFRGDNEHSKTELCEFSPRARLSIDLKAYTAGEFPIMFTIRNAQVTTGPRQLYQMPEADEVFIFGGSDGISGTIDWGSHQLDRGEDSTGSPFDRYRVSEYKKPHHISEQETPPFKVCVDADSGNWCVDGNPPMKLWTGDSNLFAPKVITIEMLASNHDNSSTVSPVLKLEINPHLPKPDLSAVALPNNGLRVCAKKQDVGRMGLKLCWSNGAQRICRNDVDYKDYQEFKNLKSSGKWQVDAKFCNANICGLAQRWSSEPHEPHYYNSDKTYIQRNFWKRGYLLTWEPTAELGVTYRLKKHTRNDGFQYVEAEVGNNCKVSYFASCAEVQSLWENRYSLVYVKQENGSKPVVREYEGIYAYQCSIIERYPVLMITLIGVATALGLILFPLLLLCFVRKCRKTLKGQRGDRKTGKIVRDFFLREGHKVYESVTNFMRDVKNYKEDGAMLRQDEQDKTYLVPENVPGNKGDLGMA